MESKTAKTIEELGLPGIFVAEYKISNMDMERIVVVNDAIIKILEKVKLPKQDQEKAVSDLVDRTPDWMELEPEEQIEKIKTVLTTETVLYFLQGAGVVSRHVDICEIGIDPEGSVVVYAYYTNQNRDTRRAAQKLPKSEKEMMEALVNGLGSQNIIDLARAKMERIKKAQETGEKLVVDINSKRKKK